MVAVATAFTFRPHFPPSLTVLLFTLAVIPFSAPN